MWHILEVLHVVEIERGIVQIGMQEKEYGLGGEGEDPYMVNMRGGKEIKACCLVGHS